MAAQTHHGYEFRMAKRTNLVGEFESFMSLPWIISGYHKKSGQGEKFYFVSRKKINFQDFDKLSQQTLVGKRTYQLSAKYASGCEIFTTHEQVFATKRMNMVGKTRKAETVRKLNQPNTYQPRRVLFSTPNVQ